MFTTIDSDKQVRTTTPIRGALVLTFVLIIGALLLFILIWAGVAYANPADDLYLAAGTGKVTAVRKLLNQGVDPNAAMDKSGVTALMQAAMTGDTDIVKLLLNKGANVNARAAQLGTTALMNAAAFGDVEMVRLLIEGGRYQYKRYGGADGIESSESREERRHHQPLEKPWCKRQNRAVFL
jgi:hypothetical protein